MLPDLSECLSGCVGCWRVLVVRVLVLLSSGHRGVVVTGLLTRLGLALQSLISTALISNPHILPQIALEQNSAGGLNMALRLPGSSYDRTPLMLHEYKKTKEVRGKETDYVAWIINAPLSDLSVEEKVVRYYVRCSNLFGKLALGRNQQVEILYVQLSFKSTAQTDDQTDL